MSIIQHAVQSAIRKIADVIIEALRDEAIFLWGVGDQVRLMETEFRRMQSFLIDADAKAKQPDDKRVRNWVRDVLHVAYNAEDAIDTFVYEIAPLRQSNGRLNTIKRYVFIFSELKALHKLGSAIGRIQIEIRGISESRSTYGIENFSQGEPTNSAGESLREHRLSSPYVLDRDFTGFQDELDSLIGDLIKEEERLCVVSLVGMGGLGKTTLATKAYNHVTVRGRFSIRAWVSVSQQYSVKELLKDIGKQLSAGSAEQIDRMTADELMRDISGFLREKKYLMVLDDVWQNDAWDCLRNTFPDEGRGSRILLTTRNQEVVVYADVQSKPHVLRFFDDQESWQLFCKKAFPRQQIGCPPDLEPTAQEIVKSCQGLPLAIAVMGGLLSSKKTLAEWQKVLKSIPWQFTEGQPRISRILSLSYEDLPYSLKPCFLYLAIFPEDYDIPANTLIQMWVAEGLLQERGNETLEEVGEDILLDLIARSLIQFSKRSSNGLIESCRIHDLLRDLAISKAKEDRFLEVCSHGACTARRLAVHEHAREYAYSRSSTPHLRCVFIHRKKSWRGERISEEKSLFKRFKLLRVLHIQGVEVRELPREIGKLVHLRYICCDVSNMRSLPSSMVNLQNLQTLYLTCSFESGLLYIPSAVRKMLRRLRNLQIASVVDLGPTMSRSRWLSQLKPVFSRKLIDILMKLSRVLYGERVTLEHCIESSLVSQLYLINRNLDANPSSSPATLPLQSPLITKSRLHLAGILNKLPDICDFPHTLSELNLIGSCLKQDPLPLLEGLQNLTILGLWTSAYLGKKMTCSAGGFPRLKRLSFDSLDHLEELIVENGSMPSLSSVWIGSCRRLQMIPEGLRFLTNLKKLTIRQMPPEFNARLQSEIGEDWNKIQHIPTIDIADEARPTETRSNPDQEIELA